ncbi:MAG TPA: hypothetical protein VJ730_03175 [Nitrososphaera sp.]|nr:hypothetical protein [Nitrososphaera sp.]
MVKASRPAVKTLTLIKSRDIVVDKMLKTCEEGNHSKCTGWAVLKKEISPIDGNYFLKCICTCHHHKKEPALIKKKLVRKKLIRKKQLKKKIKKKAKKQKPRNKSKASRKSKRSRKARRR